MRKPISNFVLSKIAGRRFTPKDLRYIDKLLTIEEYGLVVHARLGAGWRS